MNTHTVCDLINLGNNENVIPAGGQSNIEIMSSELIKLITIRMAMGICVVLEQKGNTPRRTVILN